MLGFILSLSFKKKKKEEMPHLVAELSLRRHAGIYSSSPKNATFGSGAEPERALWDLEYLSKKIIPHLVAELSLKGHVWCPVE